MSTIPVNPHRQRLLLASTVKCQLAKATGTHKAGQGKAMMAKARGKAKAKGKPKAKGKAKAAPKAKRTATTAYGRAQQEFLEELLVLNYRFNQLALLALPSRFVIACSGSTSRSQG